MGGKSHTFEPTDEKFGNNLSTRTVREVPNFVSRAMPSRFYKIYGKRLFDLLFVILAIPIIIPVMAIFYVVVRWDGGPFFFAHGRVGQAGKMFKCLKIRTMDVNAKDLLIDLIARDPAVAIEWKTHFKLSNDPRVTKIGLALRKTSLDELPQVYNVLKGEMSVVGPRPITREELSLYGQVAEDYKSVRPGLTGLWQISGRRENDFANRASLDANYVSNISFLGDLAIMLKTIPEVVKARGR